MKPATPPSKLAPGILITSNFSSDTGFAWKFFFRIFRKLSARAVSEGIKPILSFAEVVEPVDVLDKDIDHGVFEYDPININFRGLLNLRRHIKQHHIKYAYLTDLRSWHWSYTLMRLWGVDKIVVHNHISVASPDIPAPETGIRRRLKHFFQNPKVCGADKVIACSDFVKYRLINKDCLDENRIQVIPHGIELERFSNQNPKPASKLRICSIARANQYKGISDLIEAASLLRSSYQQDNFEIAYGGDGPDMQLFKDRVAELGLASHFLFLGVLDNTAEELAKSDIVVVPPNWGEAFPLAALEAMASGKAIVATEVGGIPEALEHGITGLLVKPQSPDQLAKEIDRLLRDENLRESLGGAALEKAQRQYGEALFHDTVCHSVFESLKGRS